MVGVPAALKWKRAENIYYPPDLQEAPAALLGPEVDATFATTAPEQLPSTQASLPPPETFEGPDKAGDQGQGVEVAKGKEVGWGQVRPKDKGKGKEAKALPKAKGLEADQGKKAAPKIK